MHEAMNQHDLCTTCRHRETCTYPKSRGRPVHYCTEHEAWKACEGEVSLALLKKDRDLRQSPPQNAEDPFGKSEKERPRGLCVNCANRDECTFPKPPGGVWHCEEYC